MTLEIALRATEILIALVYLQQSAEHLLADTRDRLLFLARAALAGALLSGVAPSVVCLLLMAHAVVVLHRYQGAYNGGSDRMGLLILFCLCLARLAPSEQLQEIAFGYLAIQLVLSYVVSGWVKLLNAEWRRGQALRNVFSYSAYPVSEDIRGWADRPRLLLAMSWSVILFELLFPLALLAPAMLAVGLVVAATFHLANAFLFGLNRFFWTWLAAYPSLIWFQARLAGAEG